MPLHAEPIVHTESPALMPFGGDSSQAGYTLAGVHYPTLSALARAHGIKVTTLARRLKSPHWSLEQACGLHSPPKSIANHHGKPLTVAERTFPSIAAACLAHGVKVGVFHARRRSGWSLEEALAAAPRARALRGQVKPWIITGRSFASLREACIAYALKPACVRSRLAMGWSIEEAFGLTERKAPERLSAQTRSGESGVLIICGKPFVWKHERMPAEGLEGLLPEEPYQTEESQG